MNSRYYHEQETQDLLTELEVLFNSLDKSETAFDNLGPSIGFNLSLFFGVDALWLMGPALALALIYIPLHWWIERRYRDSWEAYLTRERDRIDRISRILDLIDTNLLNLNDPYTPSLLIRFKNLIDGYVNDTKNLCERLSDEKYTHILNIQIKNKFEDNDADKKIAEEEALMAQERNLIEQLLGQERYQKYLALTKFCSAQNNMMPPQKETSNPELTALEKKQNTLEIGFPGYKFNFDIRFMGGYVFNLLLSYSLAYWLVFYYSTAAVAGALAMTPIGWALIALTFPVLYLLYKEFTTYRARLIETEEQTKEKINSDQLHFRRGWIFIALILAITLVVGLPAWGVGIAATIGIAAASLVGVILISSLVNFFIDERVKAAKQAESVEQVDTNQARKLHAQRRRRDLDDIALIAIQLAQQSKLAAQAKKYVEVMNNVFNTKLEINNTIEETQKISQTILKPLEPLVLNRKTTFIENVKLGINVVLSGLMGYALGALIGFVLNNFLASISVVFLGPLGYVISGVISLALGCFFARRAYYTEKIQQNKTSTLYVENEFAKKEIEIDALNKNIIAARAMLKDLEENKQSAIANLEEHGVISNLTALNALKQLKPDIQFAHPVQNQGVTKRKVFFAIRTFLGVLVSVATASMLVRMFLLTGFAKFIPGVVGSSLMLLGVSAGPIGFTILGLAIAVFLVKAVHDIYLEYQRQQEQLKIERVDFTIKCKQVELSYLQGQINIITPAVKVIEAEVSTITEQDSHPVLSSKKSSSSSACLDKDTFDLNDPHNPESQGLPH